MLTITNAAVASIRWYQQRLSPHKGFCCAHAAYHGGTSCSNAILHIVQSRGLFGGWRDIARRFVECGQAYAQLRLEGMTGHDVPGGGNVRMGRSRVRGVCCCGPIPIPFRWG